MLLYGSKCRVVIFNKIKALCYYATVVRSFDILMNFTCTQTIANTAWIEHPVS